MEIAPADWDALFDAVRDRLRASATQAAGIHGALSAEARSAADRALMLECAEALGLLHADLKSGRRAVRTPAVESSGRPRGSFFSGMTPTR